MSEAADKAVAKSEGSPGSNTAVLTIAAPNQAKKEQAAEAAYRAAMETLGYTIDAGSNTLNLDEVNDRVLREVKSGGQRYVLIKYTDGGAKHVVQGLPSVPSGKSIRLIPASEIRYTLQDTPIREHTSNRSWGISLRGMSGVKIFGMGSLLAFDRFVNQYHFEAHTDGELYLRSDKQRVVRDRTWLEFWDLEDGVGWKVEIRGWDWDRGAQTRVLNAEWALSLQGYAVVERLPARGGVDFRARGFKDTDAMAQQLTAMASAETVARDKLEAAARAIRNGGAVAKLAPQVVSQNALFNTLNNISDWLTKNPIFKFGLAAYQAGVAAVAFVKKAVQFARNVVDAVQTLTNVIAKAAANFTAFIQNIANIPRQLVNSVLGAVSAVRRAIKTLIQFYGDLVDLPSSALRAWREIKDAVLSLGDLQSYITKGLGKGGGKVYKGLMVGGEQSNTSGMPNVFVENTDARDAASGNCIPYKLNEGDSLEQLATTLYGDPSMWTALADFNSMQNAWTLKNGALLQPGTILLLPYSAAQGLNVPQAQQAGDLYGTDWAVDPATGDRIANNRPYVSYDGTTYTTTSPQAGDFQLVSGLPNLLQAVSHRVRTVVGEVPVAPAYGALPFPVGTSLTSAQLVQAMVSVRANMLRDGRILRVAKLTPVRKADTIDISMQVVPVTGGAVGVVAPLGN